MSFKSIVLHHFIDKCASGAARPRRNESTEANLSLLRSQAWTWKVVGSALSGRERGNGELIKVPNRTRRAWVDSTFIRDLLSDGELAKAVMAELARGRARGLGAAAQ